MYIEVAVFINMQMLYLCKSISAQPNMVSIDLYVEYESIPLVLYLLLTNILLLNLLIAMFR